MNRGQKSHASGAPQQAPCAWREQTVANALGKAGAELLGQGLRSDFINIALPSVALHHDVCRQNWQYSLVICTLDCIGGVLLSTIKSSTMNWPKFTALLILATAMSFTPGPNNTLCTARGANHGLKRARPFVCAVPVGWGALLLVCALGQGALVVAVPFLRWTIKLVGVAYLLWLASRIVRSRQLSEADAASLNVTFWQGAALQFVNIKAWMLALAIVSGWIAGRDEPALRVAVLLPVMLAYAFASNLSYALVGEHQQGPLAGSSGQCDLACLVQAATGDRFEATPL